MRTLAVILMVIGFGALVFSLVPDNIFIDMQMQPNTLRFINNYLAIIAAFFIAAGLGAWIAGKKRREMDYKH